jgi:hypothetical protein
MTAAIGVGLRDIVTQLVDENNIGYMQPLPLNNYM